MLSAIVLILATWFGLGLCFIGIGVVIGQVFGAERPSSAQGFLLAFWSGWATALLILALWHLVFPVNRYALHLLMGIGLLGFAFSIRPLWNWCLQRAPSAAIWVCCLVMVSIWFASRAVPASTAYDSGLYHLQLVRWATTYPIVPGLGNLHGRLAFNSSYFLYVALLENIPHALHGSHLANGLLFLALAAQILLAVRKLRGDSVLGFTSWTGAMLLVPLFYYASILNAASPTPDAAVFVLEILLFMKLADMAMNVVARAPASTSALAQVMFLAATGISIKLSFAVFGASAILVAAGLWLRGQNPGEAWLCRNIWRVLLPGVLVLAVWMMRGAILSGYPLYPSTAISVSVDWRVTINQATEEANWIRSWGRAPGLPWETVLGNRDWVRPWLEGVWINHRFQIVFPFGLALLSLILWLSIRFQRAILALGRLYAILPPIFGIAFWAVSAPNPRFVGALLWITAAGVVALLAQELTHRHSYMGLGLVGAVIVLQCWMAGTSLLPNFDLKANSSLQVVPTPDMESFITSSGLHLWVPASGDQCWNAPLPCTPYPNSNLILRNEATLARGFMIMESNTGRGSD